MFLMQTPPQNETLIINNSESMLLGDEMVTNFVDVFKIKLTKLTDEGSLVYVRNPRIEPHGLYITSHIKRKREYYINIGGDAVFLLDAKRILINVEFIYDRRRWKKAILRELPQPQMFANLEFINVHSFANELELPITITTDNEYSYAYVLLGNEEPDDGQWVGLSDQCLALVEKNILRGLFVKLA